MRTLLVAMSAALLVAGCSSSRPEEPIETAPALDPMSPLAAPGYLAMAASSDQFEIESSRVALQMSQNPAVRSFAQMMIDHHTRTTQEAATIAQANGMAPPPPTLMPAQQAALDRVRAAAPADFDATYKREQIAGHQEALTLHQNYAAQGDTQVLRDFATRTVPIIQQHLSQAQGLPDYAPPPPRAGERG